ncbi:MFS transporter [Salmonella enterica]|uniref:MFS transporter n=2 Tax=Salmonella enterica I TaxID=59201 RepID=A0A624B6S1_SALMO|nr:MFS transporter [Salmonella enterica]EBF0113722.1 MFS transporter [Salmonella enterica subsp. enterica]ECZ5262412.1 MFS transporter [Salmonella enterica subsp. enterica serovar Montevideo]EJU7766849.1 MFS transporter [Salmonella enterica subsp. enterica serovar 6,14:a:1,7]EAA8472585.1 MFS transporter [Salmonella enterica]EAM2912827.1 MFS transporter [Salmonella enterica]
MTELPDNTRWQLWIVAFGFFMQSLDTTIVNTALPSMAKSLGESPLHMHMVVVSYVLTVAVMLPASGWLADKIGVRNIFFAAIVLFTLGSLFCALSGTLNQLVLARVLQGVGGAMMVLVFLQIGLGFSPFHAGLMMIPMVLGSMGMKRIVVQIVNRFGYRRVLVATTLGLALVSLLFMSVALLGWYYLLPLVLLLQGMVNSARFSSMNTLTLKDLPDTLASSGNSLLSMIMQLSMSIGVTIAGMLLGMFGQQHIGIDSSATHHVFMYTWLCMAVIIALPAIIFARVPNDTQQNMVISRRKRSL